MRRSFAAVCVLVAIGCSPPTPRTLITIPGPTLNPPPAPDPSPAADAHVVYGVPPIDRPWTPKDHAAATAALRELLRTAPEELPRHGSPTSGRVFDKLIT